MNNFYPNLALACLVAMFLGIAMAKGYGSMFVWGLVIVLIGISLNSAKGFSHKQLFVGSLCAAIIVLAIILFKLSLASTGAFGTKCPDFYMSGVNLTNCTILFNELLGMTIVLLVGVFVGTVIAVFAASQARPLIVAGGKQYLGMSAEKAERVEGNVNLAMKVLLPAAAIALGYLQNL